MRGSVGKEGSSWYYRVYLGEDPLTHKKKYKRKRGFLKRKDAETALAQAILEIENGTIVENDNLTIKEYLDYFNNQYIKKNCKPTTQKRYSYSIKDINRYLGNIKLTKLNSLVIQDMYDKLQTDDGQSPNTVIKTHRLFNLALEYAIKWRLINTNWCALTVKPKAIKKEIKYWPSEKANYYLGQFSKDFLYDMAKLSLQTGMREGELCALKWNKIDLDNAILKVSFNRTRDENNKLVDSSTKTINGDRTITLFDSTVNFLRELKARDKIVNILNFKDNKNDGKISDERYVFHYDDGIPYDPHYISQKFTELIRDKKEIPIKDKITFHGLRHTHATMLLDAGVNPKVISERLGHATVAFTMDTYMHINKDLQRKEVEKASNLF